MRRRPTPRRAWSRSFGNVVAVLFILVVIGVLFLTTMSAASALPVQDLAQYWAAAHLATSNPYSQTLVTNFERSYGLSMNVAPMVMRNPPPALVFVLPFRVMNYPTAFAFWDLLSVLAVAVCARLSYSLADGRASVAPAFLSLLFGPTVALLMLGQLVVLVLLGITLFLQCVESKRDWLAGASLSLAVVKPHLALLFLAAVFLWSIRFGRWTILFSGALALAVNSAIAAVINPRIFTQYFEFARQFASETTPYPNIGGILFQLSGRHGLAFLPQVCGVAWFVFYWIRHRHDWNWKTHGMISLLVSLTCCYYSFPFDQIIVLPALMTVLAKGDRRIFLGGFIGVNLGYVLYISGTAGHFGYGPMFLWWTALGWLVTYMLTQQKHLWPQTA